MRRMTFAWFSMVAAATTLAGMASAGGQYPGGQSGPGGMGRQGGMNQPSMDMPASTVADKPDAAARKAYAAGMKSMNKARDLENAAAAAPNADKRAAELDKMGDAYSRALDQFTEALSNKGDMYEAWNNVGYIHLRLGAYAEAVDDYNHTLALKGDLYDAVEGRGEAYLGVDRLDGAQAAYMDLFNHERPKADRLMVVMQKWLADHRSNANGMRAADVDAFDKWLQEREGIARETASLPQ